MINQNFSQQILKKGAEKHNFPIANPFAQDGEQVASVAYRYRKFKVSDEVSMMVRCQLDGALEPKTTEGDDAAPEPQFITSMALNEFDPRVSAFAYSQPRSREQFIRYSRDRQLNVIAGHWSGLAPQT